VPEDAREDLPGEVELLFPCFEFLLATLQLSFALGPVEHCTGVLCEHLGVADVGR